jgi:hypothetical protein
LSATATATKHHVARCRLVVALTRIVAVAVADNAQVNDHGEGWSGFDRHRGPE